MKKLRNVLLTGLLLLLFEQEHELLIGDEPHVDKDLADFSLRHAWASSIKARG